MVQACAIGRERISKDVLTYHQHSLCNGKGSGSDSGSGSG